MPAEYETQILSATDSDIEKAAELINNGSVVGMPTETVYGLAADATNEDAVKRIFLAKGRPSDNPLIVHVCDFEMIKPFVKEIPELAYKCAECFWPGPLTMIMPKSEKIPMITSGGLDTVGIRMPSHKVALKLIKACGVPLAAPSANISGSPSPTTAKHVLNDMRGRVPAIIDGGACDVGVESTVISFEGNSIRILRPGYISAEDLKRITDNVIIDNGVLSQLDVNAVVASPGMKYKHYSPKADVYIVRGDFEAYENYVSLNCNDGDYCMLFDGEKLNCNVSCLYYGTTSQEQANRLFDTLRHLDELGAKRVFVRCPQTSGVGLAVYNRLIRAAAFKIIDL